MSSVDRLSTINVNDFAFLEKAIKQDRDPKQQPAAFTQVAFPGELLARSVLARIV